MGLYTKEETAKKIFSKSDVMKFIKRNLKNYEFPSEKNGLKQKIAALSFGKNRKSSWEQVEECYQEFFDCLDNNIFYSRFGIENTHINGITCRKVTGHFVFCEDKNLYIPICEFKNRKDLLKKDLIGTFGGGWKKFSKDLKKYKPVFDKIEIPWWYEHIWLCIGLCYFVLLVVIQIVKNWNNKIRIVFEIFVCIIIQSIVIVNIWNERRMCCKIIKEIREVEIAETFRDKILEEIGSGQGKYGVYVKRKRISLERIRDVTDCLRRNSQKKLALSKKKIIKIGLNLAITAIIVFCVEFSQVESMFENDLRFTNIPYKIVSAIGGETYERINDWVYHGEASEEVWKKNYDVEEYRVISENIKLHNNPTEHSSVLSFNNLEPGKKVKVGEEYKTDVGELWFKIGLPFETVKGWVNRRELKFVYKNEISIKDVEQIVDDDILSIPALCDGNLESVWKVPAGFLTKDGEIHLRLEKTAKIKGIVIYNGNYMGKEYSQYGKVAEMTVLLDGKDQGSLEVKKDYNLEGQFIPLSGEAKNITIKLTKIYPGESKDDEISNIACISDITIIGMGEK